MANRSNETIRPSFEEPSFQHGRLDDFRFDPDPRIQPSFLFTPLIRPKTKRIIPRQHLFLELVPCIRSQPKLHINNNNDNRLDNRYCSSDSIDCWVVWSVCCLFDTN